MSPPEKKKARLDVSNTDTPGSNNSSQARKKRKKKKKKKKRNNNQQDNKDTPPTTSTTSTPSDQRPSDVEQQTAKDDKIAEEKTVQPADNLKKKKKENKTPGNGKPLPQDAKKSDKRSADQKKKEKQPEHGNHTKENNKPPPKDASNKHKNNALKNPLLDAHQKFMNQAGGGDVSGPTQEERDNFFSNSLVDADRRAHLWMEQADIGETLVNRCSWAIPDQRAIRILRHFSPLIEIGCGSNAYWARLLTQVGVDIVAYDQSPQVGGQIININQNNNNKQEQANKKRKRKHGRQNQQSSDTSFQVHKGGPEVLASKRIRNSNRTLFLCYSDEEAFEAPSPQTNNKDDEEDSSDDDNSNDDDDDQQQQQQQQMMTSLGTECLRHYEGGYIIHVGELYGDTLSMEQAPWGRSSGEMFQQELASTFHCLLRVSLPNWIHVRDTLSVWKRSETCSIVFADDDDDDEDDEEGDMEVHYRHIPVSERLPTDIAAPCLAHLLQDADNDNNNKNSKNSNNNNILREDRDNKHKKNDNGGIVPAAAAETEMRTTVRAQLFPDANDSSDDDDDDDDDEDDNNDDDHVVVSEPTEEMKAKMRAQLEKQKCTKTIKNEEHKKKKKTTTTTTKKNKNKNKEKPQGSPHTTPEPPPPSPASSDDDDDDDENDNKDDSDSSSAGGGDDDEEQPQRKTKGTELKKKKKKKNTSSPAANPPKKKKEKTQAKTKPQLPDEKDSDTSEDEVWPIKDEPKRNSYTPEW